MVEGPRVAGEAAPRIVAAGPSPRVGTRVRAFGRVPGDVLPGPPFARPRSVRSVAGMLFPCVVTASSRFRAGKSSLLSRFVSGAFDEEYEPTIIDSLHRTMTVEGKEFDLEIVDSAGQDEFSRIPKEASIGVHGYILVYDVTSVLSFRKVQMINDTLLDSIGAESVPRVLVATKIDLAESVYVVWRPGNTGGGEGRGGEGMGRWTHVESMGWFRVMVSRVQGRESAGGVGAGAPAQLPIYRGFGANVRERQPGACRARAQAATRAARRGP